VPAAPTNPTSQMADWDFQRRYGPWSAFSPRRVLELLGDAPFVWWIAGGWSLELDDEPGRSHDDVDVVVLRRDLDAVRERLADWHLWEAHQGLRPLLPGEEPREDPEQWWVRRDAWSPWVMDVLLTPTDGDDWLYKKDHRVRRPLAGLVRRGADGVPYQVPEVTLLYKSFLDRHKDVEDLERAWPRLDAAARVWLLEAVELSAPQSPWLPRLAALGT
jgi:hypothetical protein